MGARTERESRSGEGIAFEAFEEYFDGGVELAVVDTA